MRVFVLGGAGFVGRHVVLAALNKGYEVVVGCRQLKSATRKLGPLAARCTLLALRFEQKLKPSDWGAHLTEIDAVVNCVGILRQRPGESYENIYVKAPLALALACANSVHRPRFIHVTALGLRPDAISGFNTSKWRSEQAIKTVHPELDYSIVRPSLLDGDGGFGALWLRRVAAWPLHMAPHAPRGKIAPLDVAELGQAIITLCTLRDRADLREVDLGGPQELTMAQYLQALRTNMGLGAVPCIPIPHWLARGVSHVFDVLHFSPLSFGHIELMRERNVPQANRMEELLGHAPASAC